MSTISILSAPPRPTIAKNTIGVLGDSRSAELILNGGTYGAYSIINQANARTGARLTPTYNGAVGGYRSDQYLQNLPALLASGVGYANVWGWYNDINQGYTDTQIWNGYNGSIGTKAAFDAILNNGINLFIFTESGGTLFNTTKFGYVLAINERLREYADSNSGCVLFDTTKVMWDPASTTAITFLSNILRDEVHPSNYGYRVLGNAFSSILSSVVPQVDTEITSQFEYNASLANTIGSNRTSNATFQTTSGGTAGAGITGTVPAAVSVSRSGSASAVVSTAANADGFGNDLVVQATFTAAGEYIKVAMTMGSSNYASGDIIKCGVTAYVDSGSTNFCGPSLSPTWTTSTGAITFRDLYLYEFGYAGPTTAYTNTMRTPPITIPSGATVSGVAWEMFLYGSGVGTATVRINRPWTRKQFASV